VVFVVVPARRAPRGAGVVFSRGMAPSSIQYFSLAARDIPDTFQPARLRGLTIRNFFKLI